MDVHCRDAGLLRIDAVQQEGELVAAQAGHDLPGPEGPHEPPGDGFQ
jgi:hypothetical protein